MRRFVAAAAIAGFLGPSVAAFAGEAVGVVTGVDASSHTITLGNGQTFTLANEAQGSGASLADNFKPGDKVHVIYRNLNGTPTATTVSPRG